MKNVEDWRQCGCIPYRELAFLRREAEESGARGGNWIFAGLVLIAAGGLLSLGADLSEGNFTLPSWWRVFVYIGNAVMLSGFAVALGGLFYQAKVDGTKARNARISELLKELDLEVEGRTRASLNV